MANIDHSGLKRDLPFTGTWGKNNKAHRVINSDPNNGDVLRFVKLPAGTKIYDAHMIFGAMGASVTAALGIVPVSGAAATPAAIIAATDVSSAGDVRMSKQPFTLTTECYIAVTIGGANAGGAQDIDVIIDYEYVGE